MRHRKHLVRWLAVLLAFGLLAAACGDDDEEAVDGAPAPTEEAPTDEAPTEAPDEMDDMMEHLGDGSLGTVTVEVGDAIQIRSLEAITGDVAFFGLPIDRATQIAVDDYGQIHGFDVDLGTSLDDLCSNDGGQAAAQTIVADGGCGRRDRHVVLGRGGGGSPAHHRCRRGAHLRRQHVACADF